jgi:hypothetical protein
MVGLVVSVTPLTLAVTALAVPALVPVKTTVYVPGVAVAETRPNLPALRPPARARPNALLPRPVIGLPLLSFTTIVSLSVRPDTTVGFAKLIEDLDPLIFPAATSTFGLVLSVTPLTVAVRVLAVPAVVPVKATT